jgi:hypothetical protein
MTSEADQGAPTTRHADVAATLRKLLSVSLGGNPKLRAQMVIDVPGDELAKDATLIIFGQYRVA